MYSEKCAKNYHVKKGDVVEVLSGVWKKRDRQDCSRAQENGSRCS